MPYGKMGLGLRRPFDPPKSDDEAEGSGGIRHALIESRFPGRLEQANAEIIQTTRGMLTRVVDLLK